MSAMGVGRNAHALFFGYKQMTTQDDTRAKIESDIANITGGISQTITIISKVNTLSAICGFFTALPGLVNLILQLIELFKTTPAERISDIATALTQISKAKTVEEKQNAASKLAGVLNSLP